MRSIRKLMVVGSCLLSSCSHWCFAEELPAGAWSSPVIQQVKVPAGVRGGIYYPEHEELVVVRPGAWQTLNKEDGAAALPNSAVVQAREQEVLVTLVGQMRLFDALRMIAESASKDLVTGFGVSNADITVRLKDMPVSAALKEILYPLGYGFKFGANGLLVMARDTRVFRLNLPPVTQGFDVNTSNESSSAPESGALQDGDASSEGRMRVGARVHVENTSGLMSYWQDVQANVKILLSPDGLVTLNRAAGVVVVTDAPHVLDQVGVLLDDMNARAAEQIIVDVKVVEVTLARAHKLGIDWAMLAARGDLKALGLTTNFIPADTAAGPVMTLAGHVPDAGSGVTESGVSAVVKALEGFGRVEVMSQPRVMMLNNSVASIQVGETRAYVERANVEATQSGGTITSAALGEVHGGVTLQIVGRIAGDEVFLSVTPVVSSIDEIRSIALGNGSRLEAPETSIKTMSTLVRVKAGRTAMIGGLITRARHEAQQGVPVLSRVPLVGKLFSYQARSRERSELVIFLTPRRG